jgi:hypothetical protein
MIIKLSIFFIIPIIFTSCSSVNKTINKPIDDVTPVIIQKTTKDKEILPIWIFQPNIGISKDNIAAVGIGEPSNIDENISFLEAELDAKRNLAGVIKTKIYSIIDKKYHSKMENKNFQYQLIKNIKISVENIKIKNFITSDKYVSKDGRIYIRMIMPKNIVINDIKKDSINLSNVRTFDTKYFQEIRNAF